MCELALVKTWNCGGAAQSLRFESRNTLQCSATTESAIGRGNNRLQQSRPMQAPKHFRVAFAGFAVAGYGVEDSAINA
jgi:hypothetical protein